jgi:hypothetical protein
LLLIGAQWLHLRVQALAQPDLVPLSQLEQDLGISRVDLLLLLRRLGIQPIRRGMRTLLSAEQAEQLISHVGSGASLEPITAELVFDEPGQDNLPVPVGDSWGEAARYAQLRLLRERLEILEMLMRSGIELDSRQLCDLLELRRLPAAQPLEDGSIGFIRLGLQFSRSPRLGQRSSWRIGRA